MKCKKNIKHVSPVTFEVVNDEEVVIDDKRFTKVKIWIMHLGKNYNGSVFTKEVVEDAMPTLAYIPILGFIENNKDDEEDFSDHRYKVEVVDGEKKCIYEGRAYGTVLSSTENNAHFETKICDDDVEREFLVVDGLIWNQFEEALDILTETGVKEHSMELYAPSIEGEEDEEGWFHFTKFSFSGACILGNDYRPAMEGSMIEVQFTFKDFVNNLQEELLQKTKMFNLIINEKKGMEVKENMEIKKETVNIDNNVKTANDENVVNNDTNFTLSNQQLQDEIRRALSKITCIKNDWGDPFEMQRYYLTDIQDDEIIVDDFEDELIYGIKFSTDNDSVIIDYETKKRKKIIYEDFAEGDVVTSFSIIKEILNNNKEHYQKKVTELNDSIANLTAVNKEITGNYEQIKPLYDEYVKKEKESQEVEMQQEKDNLFSSFDKYLSNLEEYTALKNQANDLSVEEIKIKCSVLFADQSLKEHFTKKETSENKVLEAGLLSEDVPNDVVMTKYGAVKINKKRFNKEEN